MKYHPNPTTKCACSNPNHHAIWNLEPDKIIKSLTTVFVRQNIDYLTNDTYKFVMNLSGFIAHYDINGFKSNYADLRKFAKNLLNSSDVKDYQRYLTDNYFSGGEQSLYYSQKAEVLKQIPSIIAKHQTTIDQTFAGQEKAEDLALAQSLAQKHGYTLNLE